MSTLSAASRLREKVVAISGTVILSGAGHPDEAIRFADIPACLLPFKTKIEGGTTWPVKLNLDRGPHQEAWAQAKRESFLRARRDTPMPEPLRVANECKDEWSLEAADIPVVEYEKKAETPVGETPATPSVKKFQCFTCTQSFPTEHGLDIHKGRTKHE